MKKTLILSALMAVAVTFMSCTSDTDDGISPAVLVSLQQQQEAEQELYKKNERVSGTWTYEYEAQYGSDNVKNKFNLTLNPNGTGTCTVTFTPHINPFGIDTDSLSYSIQNYTYDETKGLTITDRTDFDNDELNMHLHRTFVGTIEIKELTDTTMKLYVPKLTTTEEKDSDLWWIKSQMFSPVCESSFPEITTWTKLQ